MAYTSQYPPAYSDTYVKSTGNAGAEYVAHNATNPANSLTGSWANVSWVAVATGSQRFHIDLGEAKTIKRIYYENAHNIGGNTTNGVENFTFWGSDSATAFGTLTYATDTDWTQITTAAGTLDQHVAANQADPKYMLVTNSTAYRYYAIKCVDNWGGGSFIGLRRIELQTEDAPAFQPEIMLLGVG